MILASCPVSGLSQSIHKPCQNKDFSRAIDISMFQPHILTGLVIQLENGILPLVSLIIIIQNGDVDCCKILTRAILH